MNRFLTALFLIVFTGGFSQPTMFYPKGIGGGGALYFPTINPANDDEFYISCDMSELFHSADFGKSYSQLPFTSLPVLSISTYEFTRESRTSLIPYIMTEMMAIL